MERGFRGLFWLPFSMREKGPGDEGEGQSHPQNDTTRFRAGAPAKIRNFC
jgi:hypothetical protein